MPSVANLESDTFKLPPINNMSTKIGAHMGKSPTRGGKPTTLTQLAQHKATMLKNSGLMGRSRSNSPEKTQKPKSPKRVTMQGNSPRRSEAATEGGESNYSTKLSQKRYSMSTNVGIDYIQC